VISALAEEPRRIKDRVVTQKVNSAGIYLVTLYVNGVKTPVIVDDHFPSVHGQAAFCGVASQAEYGEMWGMLLEKAWAKLHGSYGRTEGGQTAHAAQHMTGLPTQAFKHNEEPDKDAFFKKMLRFD